MTYREKPFSRYHFLVFRVLFGAYLVWRFLPAIRGVDPRSDQGLTILLLSLAACLYVTGWERRPAALLLAFGWLPMLYRGSLIGILWSTVLGVVILATTFIPGGEPVFAPRFLRRSRTWAFPAAVYKGIWLLVMGAYTATGVIRLLRPGWRQGTAVIDAIRATPSASGELSQWLLALPDGLTRGLTWGVLAVLLLALPLSLPLPALRRVRPWVWGATLLVQLATLNVGMGAATSLGVVVVHLLLLDPEWLPPRIPSRHLVLYDGVCGLCNRAVRFYLAEDRSGVLRYATLQGPTGRALLEKHGVRDDLSTMGLVEDHGSETERLWTRSTAALRSLDAIGGIWRIVSWLRLVPAPIRDAVYRLVARYRYRWFGHYDSCPLPPAGSTRFFLD